MHPTHRALTAIDREFYTQHAGDFDRTRGRPWEGWRPVAEWARRRAAAIDRPLTVLDLGCGNGRFGTFLDDQLGGRAQVLGVDSSLPLLARARTRARGTGSPARWLALDLLEDFAVLAGRFDLIVAFGLLHHVPGRERRACLLRAAAALLAPGARLVVSFWQFAEDPRFAPRLVDPRAHLETLGEPTDGLEPGDHLLRWGSLDRPDGLLRFCHHAGDEEADALATVAGLRVAERYHADGRTGRLNLYLALRP